MARLPGLSKRMSKAEQLELELARQSSVARLERLIAQRAGTYVAEDDGADDPDDGTTVAAEADAPDEVVAAEADAPDEVPGSEGGPRSEGPEAAWTAGVPVMSPEAVDVTRRRAVRHPPSVLAMDDDWDPDRAAGPDPEAAGAPSMMASVRDGEASKAIDVVDAAVSRDSVTPAEVAATTASGSRSRRADRDQEAAPVKAAGTRAARRRPTAARSPVVPPPPPRVPTTTPALHPRRAARQPRQPPVLAACPSCAVVLDPRPTASRNCAVCRERIVVKRLEGGVLYLTASAGAALEAAQRRLRETARLARVRNRWLAQASAVGAPPARIERLGNTVATEAGVQDARALYLGAAGRAFVAARRERRFAEAASIRRAHALALLREQGTPEPAPGEIVDLYRDALSAELKSMREFGRDAELVAGHCCDACQADAGLVVRISDEVKAARLPHAECPKGICGCRWTGAKVAGRRPGAKARAGL